MSKINKGIKKMEKEKLMDGLRISMGKGKLDMGIL